MLRYSPALLLSVMFLAGGPSLNAAATPAPTFTLSAGNTTMTATGATIPFTLTSVNGYTGTFGINCAPANPPAGARLPYCGGGPAFNIALNANATAKGVIGLTAGPVPLAAARLNLPGARAAWAFAAVFLLGFGLRRRRARWLSILLLSVATFAGLTTLDACGSGRPTLTPGTYAYNVTAYDIKTNATAATTVNVTIPSGLPASGM